MNQSQEHLTDNKREEEQTQGNAQEETQEQTRSGYYIKQPAFGNSGPSKLRQQFNRGMSMFVVIATCIIFYFALLRLDDISGVFTRIFQILKPVIYGLAIAYLLNPIVEFVEKHLLRLFEAKFPNVKNAGKISRTAGVIVAIAILIAIIVALCNMMIPQLYQSIRDMILTVPSQINDVLNRIMQMNRNDSTLGQLFTSVMQEAADYVQNWMRNDLMQQANVMMSNLTVGVINIVSGLFDAVIGLIISVYVLFSRERFSRQAKKVVYALFKPSHANMMLHLTSKSNEIFGGFIIGKIIDSAIIGVLCFVVLSLLNMPYTLLVSVIVGVTNVVPFFGPYIGAVPSAILILLTDPKMGVYFIIFILILQQVDGNIIGPKILGNSTGLSAFWVVFAILLGGGMFGIPGMILGVPTFAVIYYIITMLLDNRLEKKKLPTATDCYDEMSYVEADGTYVHSTENEINKDKGE